MPAVASVGVFRTYKPLVLPSDYSVGEEGGGGLGWGQTSGRRHVSEIQKKNRKNCTDSVRNLSQHHSCSRLRGRVRLECTAAVCQNAPKVCVAYPPSLC